MGSKGLKAIIVNPEGGQSQPLADEKAFREASKRFAKALSEHPITGKGLAEYGTAVLVNILHEAGGLLLDELRLMMPGMRADSHLLCVATEPTDSV